MFAFHETRTNVSNPLSTSWDIRPISISLPSCTTSMCIDNAYTGVRSATAASRTRSRFGLAVSSNLTWPYLPAQNLLARLPPQLHRPSHQREHSLGPLPDEIAGVEGFNVCLLIPASILPHKPIHPTHRFSPVRARVYCSWGCISKHFARKRHPPPSVAQFEWP